MMALVPRNSTETVREMLTTFRVVVLGGARQVGKSTLVEELIGFPSNALLTLDDPGVRSLAADDPIGFLAGLPRPAAIDEFQRAGSDLLLAVKQMVDRDQSRGQLLLTGSASYLAQRGVSETLAGRAGRLCLWPLSGGERRGVLETFLAHAFDPEGWTGPVAEVPERGAVIEELLVGGYPEVVGQAMTGRQRGRWFDSYTDDVVSREALRPIAEVRRETQLRQVLGLLAARTGSELNLTDLARDAQVDRATAASYVALLEALFLLTRIPAFATSATTRAKKHPKVILTDSGLAAHLSGMAAATFGPSGEPGLAGALFESFVIAEIAKQATWNERAVDLFHFRDRNGAEIDLVIQDRRTGVVSGIEIKLTSSPRPADARHLAGLRDRLGDRFAVGLLVHTGPRSLRLGERLWAVPVTALYRHDPVA
jgi:uncharacterized protein